jgi:hypothetical protein
MRGDSLSHDAAAGFLMGAGGGLDYRSAALVHHSPGPGAGLFAGVDGRGRLFIQNLNQENGEPVRSVIKTGIPKDIVLELEVTPSKTGICFSLQALDPEKGVRLALLEKDLTLSGSVLTGSLALISHPGRGERTGRFWFQEWRVEGKRVLRDDTRRCGPVLAVQYTRSQGVLKITAQCMPLGKEDIREMSLETMRDGDWVEAARDSVQEPAFVIPFRVDGWDAGGDIPFRIVHRNRDMSGSITVRTYPGMIKADPAGKDTVVLAAFTGNHNVTRPVRGRWAGVDGGYFPWEWGVWFPHPVLVERVRGHRPDLLFFSGDQVYEGASPTAADFQKPFLDYLYKWYLWCWAFGPLTARIPAVTIPDDHDVYHGNLWGAGGKATDSGSGAKAQDSGGYKLSPDFVNMVQQTQTSHLPDPFDPAPVLQGITVYYCDLNVGGVSFAVVEDRKFKSAPKPLLPQAGVWNGWAQKPGFDPRTQADVPEAALLGERQLAFLEAWASDWSSGAWMKAVLSQTLFTNVATLPAGAKSGSVIPSLPVLSPGEYPEDDRPVADMDSNGWPPSGRNRALRIMRKARAVHVSGDQHLGSTVQYGVEAWRDAGYALCVPSVANFWPRRWFPRASGMNREPGSPRYTGDYLDGFGNRMTVFAVSNPAKWGREPAARHDLSPGYGIVRFQRTTRKITMENWPIWSDPARGGKPYPGWPVTFGQSDNDGRRPSAWLPSLDIQGESLPVVQVIEERTGETVYTYRVSSSKEALPVFREGFYTVVVRDPDLSREKRFTRLPARSERGDRVLAIRWESE